MSYQPNNHFESGLGVPGSGFASRRGGNQVFNNRLSMAPPSSISTIQETQDTNPAPTPRTSRSHLLAGLRTAPKSATYPGSAPPSQAQHHSGLNVSSQGQNINNAAPQTAYGAGFGGGYQQGNAGLYGLPEILAPPQFAQEQDYETDPAQHQQLLYQAQALAKQQAMLQQQLQNLTLAQHQMQNLSYGNANMSQQQQQLALLQQQMLGGGAIFQQMQPIVTPTGTPDVYSVYNPLTGQTSFQYIAREQIEPETTVANVELSHSPPPTTPTFHAQVSPPPESNAPVQTFRSPSPPKSRSPPVNVTPLPPPSATAFRRGHTKQLSSVTGGTKPSDGFTGPPRTASFPLTPQTGGFGPGQSRAGEHPIRQPRGPPSIEELKEKPTSKHEGSKNFATRQRRRAFNSLVKAGVERRGVSRGSNSIDSPGSGTPSSEIEITFSVTSDSDNESGRSSRGSIHGAIGAERNIKKGHSDKSWTAQSLSSDEGIGGKMLEIKIDEVKPDNAVNPLHLLAGATEKRKSAIF